GRFVPLTVRRAWHAETAGRLAQLEERRPYKAEVGGSKPSAPTVKGQVSAMFGLSALLRRGDAWRVHVYVGRDEVTGKQRHLTRTVHGTKREAEKVLATVDASK